MKKVIFAISAEDVSYVESIRVYNVSIPFDVVLKEVMNYCPFCGEKLKQKKDSITGKKSKYLLGCDCQKGRKYQISKG